MSQRILDIIDSWTGLDIEDPPSEAVIERAKAIIGANGAEDISFVSPAPNGGIFLHCDRGELHLSIEVNEDGTLSLFASDGRGNSSFAEIPWTKGKTFSFSPSNN